MFENEKLSWFCGQNPSAYEIRLRTKDGIFLTPITAKEGYKITLTSTSISKLCLAF